MPDWGAPPVTGKSPLNRCFALYKIRKRRRHPTATVPLRRQSEYAQSYCATSACRHTNAPSRINMHEKKDTVPTRFLIHPPRRHGLMGLYVAEYDTKSTHRPRLAAPPSSERPRNPAHLRPKNRPLKNRNRVVKLTFISVIDCCFDVMIDCCFDVTLF